jgi:para-aminobenzoate synthetase/4-amino-4-deoxychorismate lyase
MTLKITKNCPNKQFTENSILQKVFRCYIHRMRKFSSPIEQQQNSVLLETVKVDSENFTTYLFTQPVEILSIFSLDDVPKLFQRIEEYLAMGLYVAGYCTYEMGLYFENVSAQKVFDVPIAWFGVYQEPARYESDVHKPTSQTNLNSPYSIHNVRFSLSDDNGSVTFEEYANKMKTIRQYIREGDVYQINFTGKIKFSFDGSPLTLYEDLTKKQKVSYNAIVQTEYGTIVSLSPELFFRRQGSKLITRPMKGTAPRGKTLSEDETMRTWLKNDKKSHAENIMIVDLVRNDMGKISDVGSVKATSLCEVEQYETLFQMISTIESKLKEHITYYDIFQALFPSGSVTGAPKIRAMQIINELEEHQRGVYTGAIGFISPHQSAVFSVAIRTIVLHEGKGEMGVGGGIVWDSTPEQEYNECLLKAKFLTEPHEKFSLIETILWNGAYPHLEQHLRRMRDSALYFGFAFDEQYIRQLLQNAETTFVPKQRYKVRLLLDEGGEASIQISLLEESHTTSNKVCLSAIRTQSNNRFLYHKTTNRRLYDRLVHLAHQKGYADVLFLNERDEITEGAISNVLIKKNEKYFTPPIECGVLNGVYRQYLFTVLTTLEERRLSLEHLRSADSLYLCNAVRGMYEVSLVEEFIRDE